MARKRMTVRDLLARLDSSASLDGLDLTLFSDLGEADLAEVEAHWPDWSAGLRRALLSGVAEIAEDDFRVNFDALARLGLDDSDGEVRAAAVATLWDSEEADLIAVFLRLMLNDPAAAVRSEAAKNLGKYVYQGECGDLQASQARRIEDALLGVIAGVDELEVRRRAVESVAHSGRPEIVPIIEAAYRAPQAAMRASAVYAMGRNLDERWHPLVLEELGSPSAEMRFEAARAAGDLELEPAVPALARLTGDANPQVQEAAIWSLGEIGGDEAQAALLRRRRGAPSELRELIDDSLANANLDDLGLGPLEIGANGADEDATAAH